MHYGKQWYLSDSWFQSTRSVRVVLTQELQQLPKNMVITHLFVGTNTVILDVITLSKTPSLKQFFVDAESQLLTNLTTSVTALRTDQISLLCRPRQQMILPFCPLLLERMRMPLPKDARAPHLAPWSWKTQTVRFPSSSHRPRNQTPRLWNEPYWCAGKWCKTTDQRTGHITLSSRRILSSFYAPTCPYLSIPSMPFL